MSLSEIVLEQAGKDGSINLSEWPRVLDAILARLEKNVYCEFAIPTEPPQPILLSSPSKRLELFTPVRQTSPTIESPGRSNEPVPPPPTTSQSEQPSPSKSLASMKNKDTTTSQTTESPLPIEPQELTASIIRPRLPPPVLSTYTYITATLTSTFASAPPHTIQRLSELLLNPLQHYRHLPAYLNALQRTVSVSSPSTSFPLPAVEQPAGAASVLVNGTNDASCTGKHDDEHLGGALLTPIPWLMHRVNGDGEFADGEEGDVVIGMSGVESIAAQGPVTQGELLRLEQEVGDPPAPITAGPSRNQVQIVGALEDGIDGDTAGTGDAERGEYPEMDTEAPHARGPEVVGMEDLGPQAVHQGGGLNMAAAVGRDDIPAAKETASMDESAGEAEAEDEDGDIVLSDVVADVPSDSGS